MTRPEIDLLDGSLLRTASLAADPGERPSTFDRFFDWIFGWVAPHAAAGVLIEPGVTIAPDGRALYLVPGHICQRHLVDDGAGDRIPDHQRRLAQRSGYKCVPASLMQAMLLDSCRSIMRPMAGKVVRVVRGRVEG